MTKTSFNFDNIKRNYPVSYAKLMNWLESDKEVYSITGKGRGGNFIGFYWLSDFFDQQGISAYCTPSLDTKGVFQYYVHGRKSSVSNDIHGTRRDTMREAYLGAFIFLEKHLTTKK